MRYYIKFLLLIDKIYKFTLIILIKNYYLKKIKLFLFIYFIIFTNLIL